MLFFVCVRSIFNRRSSRRDKFYRRVVSEKTGILLAPQMDVQSRLA